MNLTDSIKKNQKQLEKFIFPSRNFRRKKRAQYLLFSSQFSLLFCFLYLAFAGNKNWS